MDPWTRRGMVGSGVGLFAVAASAQPASSYVDYPFADLFGGQRGPGSSPPPDVQEAVRISSTVVKNTPFETMVALSELKQRGTTGELFNSRWRQQANPLIVLFFHDIGYHRTPYPGDCTSWCAATVSWCLLKSEQKIAARDPASSQSYLNYGTEVKYPQVGDLCVFTDVADSSHGHVAFFKGRVGDKLVVVGGNQSGVVPTACGAGYLQSKICETRIPINAHRDPKVGVHYLAKYVRPV